MTEVGVSLALRRQNKLFQSEKPPRRKQGGGEGASEKTSSKSATTASKPKKRTRPDKGQNKPKQNASWQIFVEGAALYTFCLVLPNIVTGILRWFGQNGVGKHICSLPWISSFDWCIRNFHLFDGQTGRIGSASSEASLSQALASDAAVSDVAIVMFLSLTMAVVRLTLVHFLVPDYNQPKRLRALVRCKSIHLLSSSYPGTVTPRSSVKGVKSIHSGDLSALAMPGLPDITNDHNNDSSQPASAKQSIEMKNSSTITAASAAQQQPPTGTLDNLDDDSDDDFQLEKTIERMKRKSDAQGIPLTSSLDNTTNHKLPNTNNISGDEFNNSWFIDYDNTNDSDTEEKAKGATTGEDNDLASAPAVSSGLLTSSSAQSLQALLQQATPMAQPQASMIRRSNISNEDAVRVFAAPKYATAVFRLLFSSVSCMIALIYFRDAEFWPPAVGGTGCTKNCWDLSSVGTAVMESDFDHRNTVLRHYFLFQASYHFHSGAFHILAALLLWFVSATNKEQQAASGSSFFPSGLMTIQNVQSLFQHSFGVGLIAGTYLFSSLRRLAAIGMFAFDLSSLFLHLLQLSINSPHGSRRISPGWIRILHRGLVIPAFCYTRFYVFPFVIAYSAFEESDDWLRQLENMWFTGTAKYIHNLFVVSFSLLMVMNFVYVRRLINHPHVRDTLHDKSKRYGA